MNKIQTPKFATKLKNTWDEDPIFVIGVALSTAFIAVSTADTISQIQSRRAYSKMVKNSQKKNRR